MKVTIKKLSNDSCMISEVKKFLFAQIKKEFGYDYIPEWHQDIMNMEYYYINPKKNNFFVAYDENNEIISTIGIRAYDKNFPEFRGIYSENDTSSIWRLFVEEKYRRCGLASKMFSLAENFANECNYKSIYLHTHKTLPGALKFWSKMGFVPILDAEDELKTVHMDKKIQSLEITSSSLNQYAIML